MTINRLYEKYQGRVLEDCGARCSGEFKRFASDFRVVLRGIAKEIGANMVKFETGHYVFFGFIEKDDQYIYFSFAPTRGKPIDLDRSDSMNGILYREANCETDYSGGKNHFTNIKGLGAHLAEMFMSKTA